MWTTATVDGNDSMIHFFPYDKHVNICNAWLEILSFQAYIDWQENWKQCNDPKSMMLNVDDDGGDDGSVASVILFDE